MTRTLHTGVTRRPYHHKFWPIYTAVLLLILHTFFVAYINSSFLEQFIPDTGVGLIYTVGSAVSVLIFLFISRVLHQVGNFNLTVGLLILNFAAILGMSQAESLRVAVPLFIVHLIAIPLIVFNLDVFMEELIGNQESDTGKRRGLLLTLGSFIGALAPFISSLAVDFGGGDFKFAYLISAFVLTPIIFIIFKYFRHFDDPPYKEIQLFTALRTFWVHRNIRWVFLTHFILQIFFMFMVVYAPLYLIGHNGMSWREFGVVMFFAQLAYVLLEYPVGIIADKYIGEKEMMAMGFLIIGVASSWMSFVSTADVALWIIIMFVLRVGASLAEVTTESYFFKQINGSDAQIISFFRVTRPLAYVMGAMIGSLSLLYLPFNLLFTVLGLMMVPAMFFAAQIQDTK